MRTGNVSLLWSNGLRRVHHSQVSYKEAAKGANAFRISGSEQDGKCGKAEHFNDVEHDYHKDVLVAAAVGDNVRDGVTIENSAFFAFDHDGDQRNERVRDGGRNLFLLIPRIRCERCCKPEQERTQPRQARRLDVLGFLENVKFDLFGDQRCEGEKSLGG